MKHRLFSRPFRAIGRLSGISVVCTSAFLIFGTRGFSVYGSCMEPNLKTGERVLASRMSYWFNGPQRGDVVIFKYPCDPSKNYVKRVIGLPGDSIKIESGKLYVNDKLQNEPYKLLAAHGDYGPETIKKGNLFVMGDNRDQSNDSRYWGELPLANVQAKAVLLYWPPSRAHFLN